MGCILFSRSTFVYFWPMFFDFQCLEQGMKHDDFFFFSVMEVFKLWLAEVSIDIERSYML